MELDNNNTQTPVTNDDKRLAEAKKVTIQPLHPEVTPEELPDSQIAAQHANSPTIGNAANDIEQNTSPVPPSAEASQSSPDATPPPVRHSSLIVYIAAIVLGIGIICTGLLFFMV